MCVWHDRKQATQQPVLSTFILNNFCSGSAARKDRSKGRKKSPWASTTHWKFLHSMRSRWCPFTLKPSSPPRKLKTHVILYSSEERSSESDLQNFFSFFIVAFFIVKFLCSVHRHFFACFVIVNQNSIKIDDGTYREELCNNACWMWQLEIE